MGTAIRCPSCRSEFELSDVMRAEMEANIRAGLVRQFERESRAAQERVSREAEERVRAKEQELADAHAKLATASAREADLLRKQRELAEREQLLAVDFERRVDEERVRIREQEAGAARERFAREAQVLVRAKDEELRDAQVKLSAAAAREADLLKKQRELADRERELAVETQRRIDEETAKVREREEKRLQQLLDMQEQQQRLREEEHHQRISGLEKTIAELQRKVQQGSQQTQGEAQEVVLRDLLAGAFPGDTIDDVPKGLNGADVVQTVRGADGRDAGAIVWESKRTRHWSDGWLPKVRDDQREASAAIAVIVTHVMPADVRHFGQKDGVWVCAPSYAVALGAALRGGLLEAALARRTAEGSGQKMQLLYEYMTGTAFRNRVAGLVEAFVDMQDDLASERRATLTRWKRREKMLERALENITAFCGDLQGIAGRPMKDLLPAALESVRALPDASEEDGPASAGASSAARIVGCAAE